MNWKFTEGLPVYQQIMVQIQSAVLSGEFPPGSKIPSVRELAAQARVNPNTMQHALQELESEQLLIAMGSNGRFVTEDTAIIEKAKAVMVQKLTAEFVLKLEGLGIPPSQAAQLLANFTSQKEEN